MKGTISMKMEQSGSSKMEQSGSSTSQIAGDNSGAATLALWLWSDSPSSKRCGSRIASRRGARIGYIFHGVGNNFGTYQFGEHVFIRGETDESEESQVLLTVQQVMKLLTAYDGFTEDDRVPKSVEVEFIATGKEAKMQFEKLAGVELGKPLIIEWIDEEKAAEAAAKGRA